MNFRHLIKQFNIRKFSNTADDVIAGKLLKTPSKIKASKIPIPLYGGKRLVTMLPGSGVGPELTYHMQDVFHTAHVPVDFEIISVNETKDPINEAVTSVRRNGVAIKANLGSKFGNNSFAPNVFLRTELDLFVYNIHFKGYPNVKCRQPGIDIVVIRQNTEGEYAMLEHENVNGVVESMKVVTRANTERLAKWAFKYATRNKRNKITVIHKLGAMQLADGLFLDTVRQVAKEYPSILLEDMSIDRCSRKLITTPQDFDILLLPNLYGSIVSNIICGLLGGAGLFSGRNLGENFAIFEPATRHTGLDIAGKNIANPAAMLNASVDLLNYLELYNHAEIIRNAVNYTLSDRQIQTVDIGGIHTTTDVINCVKEYITDNILVYRNMF